MPHTLPDFSRFIRLAATLRVADDHAHKKVETVTVTLEVTFDETEPGDPSVWLTDVRLQDGKQFSAWEPNLAELLARHGRHKIVTDGVYEWDGEPAPPRFFNLVGRGHHTVVVPNFGTVPAPATARIRVRDTTSGLWVGPGVYRWDTEEAVARILAARPHIRSRPRFETHVLGPPDEPEQSERRTFELERAPVSERRWEASLILRNPEETQQLTLARHLWRVENNLFAEPPVGVLVIDSIPPFVPETWVAHLDYTHTPAWTPDQLLRVSTPERSSTHAPTIVGYRTAEPGTFSPSITIPSPEDVEDTETGLVAFASGRQGAAGAPSGIVHPSGWTVLHEVQSGDGNGHVTGWVAYLPEAGDAADYTWEFTGASLRASGGILRVSGADLEALISASAAATGTSGPVEAPGIEVPEGALLLWLGGSSEANTIATPAGMLARWGLLNQSSETIRHFHRLAFSRAPKGATGPREGSHNGTRWCAFLVGVTPKPLQHPRLGTETPEAVRTGGWPMIAGGPYVELESVYGAGTPLVEGQPITAGEDGRLAVGGERRWTALVSFEEYDRDHPAT